MSLDRSFPQSRAHDDQRSPRCADYERRWGAICKTIGTTPSNAIRMFVSAFNRKGGFPFDPSNPYDFNAKTLQAMDDAANGRNLSGP